MRPSRKPFAAAVAAALMALGTTAACADDSTESTGVSDYCSQLDVNCVLDDGRTIRVCSRAVIEHDPKHERNGEVRVRSDYGGPCGVWRLPWRDEQEQVGRTVPIRFSETLHE
jgi:hypothetical protein